LDLALITSPVTAQHWRKAIRRCAGQAGGADGHLESDGWTDGNDVERRTRYETGVTREQASEGLSERRGERSAGRDGTGDRK